MVERTRVTNTDVAERTGVLLSAAHTFFEQKYRKPPKVTPNNGYRMEYALDTPKLVAKTNGSKLFGLVKLFDGMMAADLYHGRADINETKIVSLGYVARANEDWLSLTIVNGNRDPFGVWIGSKGEYLATNSTGNAKEINFGSEHNHWLLGLFGEIEELFFESLKFDGGEVVCFDAPYSGPKLNKNN